MKRRSTRGKAGKARRRKAATPKRAVAPKATRDATSKTARLIDSAVADLQKRLERQARELEEARQQQAASSEVLHIISASAGALMPVFKAIVKSAVELCGARFGAVFRMKGDLLHLVTDYNFGPAQRQLLGSMYPMPPSRGHISGRTILIGAPVQIPDINVDEAYKGAEAKKSGFRGLLAAPLLQGGRAIGSIVIYRTEPGAFTERQLALLQTFADQAVIAIENVRLFEAEQQHSRELSESLEQQTATSEVLRVISSSPGELQPVFEAMLANATRLCDASYGAMWLCEGDCFRGAAFHGDLPAAYIEQYGRPFRPSAENALARVARTHKPVNIADTREYRAYLDGNPLAVAGREVAGIRSFFTVPMLKENELVGAIAIYRKETRAFTEKQIELVTNFASQAVIAIENTRLLNELRQRTTDLTEALEQQTASSEVLKVISTSPGELEPVFQAMLENAVHICEAKFGNLFLIEGDNCRWTAGVGTPHKLAEYFSQTASFRPTLGGHLDRVIRTKQVSHTADDTCEAVVGAAARLAGARSTVCVPMLKEDTLIGAIFIYRTEVRPFTDKQIALVENFAAQAVIAIENARLLDELRQRTDDLTESLEQQTATSEVLRVISSAPGELESVFETILDNAVHLCEASFGLLLVCNEGEWNSVAERNVPAAFSEFMQQRGSFRPRPGTPIHQLLQTKQVIRRVDDSAEPVPSAAGRFGGARSHITVPMLKENEVIGAIVIYRKEVRPFTDKQTALVESFAAQSVIAIENARLLNELRDSLERQTATSEVLSIISSSPGELEPVFQAMLANATRVCEAKFGLLNLRDGEVFRNVALYNVPEQLQGERLNNAVIRPHPQSGLARLVRTMQVVHIEDLTTTPAYREGDPVVKSTADLGGARTLLLVPMLKERELLGAFVIYRTEVRPFTDKQIALVQNFAAQAVIAIENTRLLNELRNRTDELARSVGELRALGEVGQAVNSTLDVETVLRTIVTKAVELSTTDAGAIYVFDDDHQEFRLRATYGMSEAMIAAITDRHIGVGDFNVGEAARRREPVQIADLREAPASALNDIVLAAGYRALLVVPLLGPDRIVGALVVRRREPGAFQQSSVDLLQTFADQSAIALENARLFDEIAQKSRELEIASQHKSQFVANMSHELRTPLAAMLGYAELMQEGIYEPLGEKSLAALTRIRSNGKHLLGLINTVLDIAKIESGQFTLNMAEYSIDTIVETVRVATESLAQNKKLALTTTVTKPLPIGTGDEQRLTQVLLNLVGNAIKFTDAGEVRVTAEAADGRFAISVVDTGPGIPEQERTRIFEQFHQVDDSNTKTKGGTGLGLAIAKQIVEMHGGRIWVDSTVGKGSTFQMELPIRAEKTIA